MCPNGRPGRGTGAAELHGAWDPWATEVGAQATDVVVGLLPVLGVRMPPALRHQPFPWTARGSQPPPPACHRRVRSATIPPGGRDRMARQPPSRTLAPFRHLSVSSWWRSGAVATLTPLKPKGPWIETGLDCGWKCPKWAPGSGGARAARSRKLCHHSDEFHWDRRSDAGDSCSAPSLATRVTAGCTPCATTFALERGHHTGPAYIRSRWMARSGTSKGVVSYKSMRRCGLVVRTPAS